MAKRRVIGIPTKGKLKTVTQHEFPRSAQDHTFCERWLEHFDHVRAYREAGWAAKHASVFAIKKLNRFREYLRPLREAKARVVAEKLVLSQETLLTAMARKAFFNPLDFIERTDDPLVKEVSDKDGHKQQKTLEWNGKPIYGERLKPLSELTLEQAAIVQIVSDAGGTLRYRLPTIQEQHLYQKSIGQQMGMFLEKLIVERHHHVHKHAHLELKGVSTERLANLTLQLLPLVGEDFATQLGYTAEEVKQAAQTQGVLMPERSKTDH